MTRAEADDKPHPSRPSFERITAIAPAADAKNSPSSRSPTTPIKARKNPGRSKTSPCLSDEPKGDKALPFRLRRHRPKIFDKYKILKSVGMGQFGRVFAVNERHPVLVPRDKTLTDCHHCVSSTNTIEEEPRSYACKVVDIIAHGGTPDDDRRSLEATNRGCLLEDVMNEIDLLGHCGGHPNVQDIIDFDVEDTKAYIVSSLYRGGDLVGALDMRGSLCEEDARNVMAGILNGLAHLHSRGVVHRDIKLENILLADCKHDMTKVKIIDMGLAKLLPAAREPSKLRAYDDEALLEVCGTPLYLAPEVIRPTVEARSFQSNALYGTKADMWSCGIILYCLLSGFQPFQYFSSLMELFEDIHNADYDFSDPVWGTVSDEALAMIQRLLEADPEKRLTAEEALRHPWMVV